MIGELKKATPYMLRNDGEIFDVSPIHPYVKYCCESSVDALSKLSDKRFFALEWFYKNTKSADTKQLILIVLKYMRADFKVPESLLFDSIGLGDIPTIDSKELDGYLDELNDNVNQEFCRFRTSNIKFRGDSGDIYFRISSIGFNWFPLIWQVVYSNSKWLTTITISRDKDARDFSQGECYKVRGKEINHMQIDEFISLHGNPVT